jgi:PAS domain S-box-containing protein
VTGQNIDHVALFAATPSPCLVLTPDLIIVEVNQAYLEACGRTREELLGRYVFDAFPFNPADPDEADAARKLEASLRRVLTTGERDTVSPQKYAIPVAGGGGQI